METKSCKRCSACKKEYDTSSFANIGADGEPTDAEIWIYGEIYPFCPKCSHRLDQIIQPFMSGQEGM